MLIGSFVRIQAQDLKSISGQTLTPRDITQDLRALTDDSIVGVLKSIGRADTTATDYRGRTLLWWHYSDWTRKTPNLCQLSTTAAALTLDTYVGTETTGAGVIGIIARSSDRAHVNIYAGYRPDACFQIDSLRLEAAGTVSVSYISSFPFWRVQIPEANNNEVRIFALQI